MHQEGMATVKDYVAAGNEDWQQRYKHLNIEDTYEESEIVVDETVEGLIININNESDSDVNLSSEED
ncbi:hypothetical protein Trydic_g11826 [Trypoxylus dichotomus]